MAHNEYFIEKLLKYDNKKDITVVQIGANDGVSLGDEVLHSLIKKNDSNWKSILVEPVKATFDKLQRNYSGTNNVSFENVAIGNAEEVKPIYFNDSIDFLASLYEDFASLHNVKNNGVENVYVKKFSYLKEKYDLDKIDILQIDTEGYDYIVWKEIMSYGIFPSLFKLEHVHITEENKKEIIAFAKNNGYNHHISHWDIICEKQ